MRTMRNCGHSGVPMGIHKVIGASSSAGTTGTMARARDAVRVQDQGEQDADENAFFQVDQGAESGSPTAQPFRPCWSARCGDVVEVDQAPGHQKQDAGHGRVGQEGGERRHQQQDQQQEDGGENRGQRSLRAGGVVDAAAVEGAAGGVAGEESCRRCWTGPGR